MCDRIKKVETHLLSKFSMFSYQSIIKQEDENHNRMEVRDIN